MATNAHDFASPERAPTTGTQAFNRPSSPRSPVPVDRHRAHSNASFSSVNTANLRHRRMSRTNTVKTYHEEERPMWQPGAEPGIDANAEQDPAHLIALHEQCDIDIIDFSEDSLNLYSTDNDGLEAALSEPRPDDIPCRWISINGLSWDVIKMLGNKFGLHRLAIEDLINTSTRTKVDWYSDHAFAVLTLQKLVRIHSHDSHENGEKCDCPEGAVINGNGNAKRSGTTWSQPFSSKHSNGGILPRYELEDPYTKISAHSTTSVESPIKPIRTLHRYESSQSPEHTAFMERHSALAEEDLVVSVEQVAIFLMTDNTVISFFEHSGQDVQAPIMDRLNSRETILRRSGDASMLLQAIIDTIVDLAIPVKDAYNKARKDMQIDVLTNPDIGTSKSLYIFSEEIDMLQNLFKPIVHLVNALRDHNADPLGPAATTVQSRPDLRARESQHNIARRRPAVRTQTSTTVVITPLAHTYLGDVLDHCITIIQSLEQMDASANNLSSLIFNTVGANTNNFMMILALVTVFFSPLTFISGYFGMNFTRFSAINQYSDAFFWVVALPSVFAFMMAVSGGIMWRAFKNRLAKVRIRQSRNRRAKKVKSDAAERRGKTL